MITIEPLQQYYQELLSVDDISWSKYLLAKDLLANKISVEDRETLIRKALECGKEQAEELKFKYPHLDVEALADRQGAKIQISCDLTNDSFMRFAEYLPPLQININWTPLKEYSKLLETNSSIELPPSNLLYRVILGHELFHLIEEQNQNIYTRSQKFVLWKFWGYCHQSSIRALSEIGAMAFTKEINQTYFSPLLLEVLLTYPINPTKAANIYAEIQGVANR